MKHPINQNQHKLPQVYMRQFGYEKNGHSKVSVLKLGEKFTRQKSIESFLSETNIFDIESDILEIVRIFEHLNGLFENEYHNIIRELDEEKKLSDKSYSVLLQFIPNLISRSQPMRELVTELLKTDAKENFLTIICAHRSKTKEELHQQDFFRVMADNPVTDSSVNRALIFFTEYLFRRTEHYDIVIIESQDEKPWFTTDNPVVFENRMHKFEIMGMDSEIYFPLNPKYLIYLHYQGSKDKENELRKLANNTIHLASDNQNQELQRKIMANAHEYVIVEGELKYKIGDKKEEMENGL